MFLLYIISWYLFYLAVDHVCFITNNNFSTKWSTNIVSAVHSISTCINCYLILIYPNLIPKIWVYQFSISYFIYDMFNYRFGSFFMIHHISSIAFLIHSYVVHDPLILFSTVFFIELGNFPVYVMYALINHPDKQQLRIWYRPTLILEFVWFVLFRIIALAYICYKTDITSYRIIGAFLLTFNIKWVTGLGFKVYEELVGA